MSEHSLNKASEPKDVEGARARVRSQSESSLASDDGNANTSTGKRQRTTSQTFMVTSAISAASPPKFVSLEEIMQAANGMKDMALVHRIVVEKDFRLQRYEPEENSIQKIVKETMHKAFWDNLRSDFDENPPNYDHALVLLDDVRQGLFDLLLERQVNLRQQIGEVLDKDLIKQKARHGVLDFQYYAEYVISIMSKMCAPVRDNNVKELSQMTDVVDTFRGILETLDLMALDMANFTILLAKPELIAQSVKLEREKFEDYLKIAPDGLEFTRKWFLKHLDITAEMPENIDRTTYVRNLTRETFIKATKELIMWDLAVPYPETFMLDVARLQDLQVCTERIIIIGTVLLVTVSNVGANLSTLASFKEKIKEHCSIIMESYKTKSDLKDLLPNIAIQVIKDVKECQTEHGLPNWSEINSNNITALIIDVGNEENKIRKLVTQRTQEFFQQIVATAAATSLQVPSGLTALQQELSGIGGQFFKIVSHNTRVFCTYYFDIIDAALPKNSS